MSASAYITIHEGQPPIAVTNSAELDQALHLAFDEAHRLGILGAITIKAANGNIMTIVVGADETVLTFNRADRNPPYYASRGAGQDDEPFLTYYLNFEHHSEFPRRYVVTLADGILAIRDFLQSGQLPVSITWQEV